MPTRDTILRFLDDWKEALRQRDIKAAQPLFAPGFTFHSPAVFTPYTDFQAVLFILGNILDIVKDFKYTHTLINNDNSGCALVFEGRILSSERYVQGIDLFTIDDTGRISDLTVMLRPMRSTMLVAEEMGRRLQSLKAKI
eukprot:CAMPEP_0177630216 /NCGR_PEP_ID=MMETSP0447-20121125/1092_1 /TAXON_ID=0 /ORGANISM="Stygamoeba regulata, Strain BSH-02190019" /LENGTH=139 /DNA_ID=CAMNT_0019131607 /DNA_START=38 /DNA_END=457 /DNA_ORIENTATION=-